MHKRLAQQIRGEIDSLVDQYDTRLRMIPGYADLPGPARRNLGRSVLELIADCVETNNEQPLLDYVHQRAEQVLALGYDPEWFQRAVAVPEEIVTPLVITVAESNFVWRAVTRAQQTAWRLVAAEYRRAESSLQDSEARFRALFEKSADAYLLIADGLFVDCNPATVQMMRAHTKEEFLAVHPSVLSPDVQPDGRRSDEKADDMMRRALEHGSHRFEWLHRRMDGEVFPVEVLLTPIMMGGQQVIFTVWRDISERKRAEAQIQANLSEARLRLDISQALASTQTQEQVWEALIQHAGLYPQAHISLFSLEPHGDDFLLTLRRAAAFESGLVDTLPVGSQLPVAHFPLLRQGAIEQPFLTHDFLADERLDAASRELGRRAGIASLVTFPLSVGREWLGVLVAACATPAYFDPAKQQWYHTLAEQGALALQTARLREAIQTSLARRGAQVQTSTEVAQEIATAPALDELFQRVVTLIKERFGYYHAQLFRYDPAQDAVVLVSGYGEAGQQMLAAQHRLTLGRGVVGTAAATARSILASDVTVDQDWRPNPHLPDTHGELAVPITLRQEVLGILDVQSDRAGALTVEDQLLLEGLCGQIALAIESRRVEDALREREEDLHAMLEYSPEAIGLVNTRTGLFESVNQRAERLYGLNREDLVKVGPAQMSPEFQPDGRPSLDKAMEKIGAALKGEAPVFEWVHLNATGQPIQCEVRLVGLTGVRSHLVRFSVTDITERKQAEEELRRAQQLLRTIMQTVPDYFYVKNTKSEFVLANQALADVLHLESPDELIGKTDFDFFPHDIAEKFYQDEQTIIRSGQPLVGIEEPSQSADGRSLWISTSKVPFRNSRGEVDGFVGLGRDITARRQTEEALRQSETHFRAVTETANYAIITANSQGVITNWNRGADHIFRYTGEDVVGQPLTMLMPEHYHALHLAGIERVGTGGEQHVIGKTVELYAIRKTGEEFPIEISLSTWKSQEERFYTAIITDITERKQAEEALAAERNLIRTLIDTIPDLIYAKDVECRFILANTATAQRMGAATTDELIGKSDLDFYPRDLALQYVAAEQPIVREGRSVIGLEEPAVDASGQQRWHSSTKVPLRNNRGDIIGLVGITSDISERKQAGDALAAERYLIRALIDATPDLIYAKDMESRFILANNATARQMGAPTADDLLGKSDLDFYPHDLALQYLAAEQPIVREGKPIIGVEEPTIDISGHTRWQTSTKVPLRNATGDIIGLVGITRDVTDQKQAELELERLLNEQRKRALQLQTAAEVSRAASSMLDLDQLLPQAAELIRGHFELYYVGIFLLDEEEQWAILRAGTGAAGQRMLAASHKLKVGGVSMIGQCITTQQAYIALDVGEASVRFNNPLLPLTRSEMALPLMSRGRVIGAMTIQSDQPAAFSQDDVAILRTMADQIGNAVENARLYEQTRAALAEVDAINRRLTGEAWETYLHDQFGEDVIYITDQQETAPEVLLQVDDQLSAGEMTWQPDEDRPGEAIVTAPILLRGQPIGALRVRTLSDDWNQDLQAVLSDVASHVAQAVENARLIEQTQRTATRERTINEINARVRQTIDLDAILRTAVNELGQTLKAARVVARVGVTTAEAQPSARGGPAASGNGRGEKNG